ncbi:MAG: transposase [Chitinophagaceae bacterium]|nr:transposase [Chitinophagaceae bacterium]
MKHTGICIDAYLFDSIDEIREVTQTWVDDYNCTRPHDALNGLSPKIYREKTINLLGCVTLRLRLRLLRPIG